MALSTFAASAPVAVFSAESFSRSSVIHFFPVFVAASSSSSLMAAR